MQESRIWFIICPIHHIYGYEAITMQIGDRYASFSCVFSEIAKKNNSEQMMDDGRILVDFNKVMGNLGIRNY